MNEYKWFAVPLMETEEVVSSRLLKLGFIQKDHVWVDAQNRQVLLSEDAPDQMKIGIPVSDFLGEQEQLEYVLGHLGFDLDDARSV